MRNDDLPKHVLEADQLNSHPVFPEPVAYIQAYLHGQSLAPCMQISHYEAAEDFPVCQKAVICLGKEDLPLASGGNIAVIAVDACSKNLIDLLMRACPGHGIIALSTDYHKGNLIWMRKRMAKTWTWTLIWTSNYDSAISLSIILNWPHAASRGAKSCIAAAFC